MLRRLAVTTATFAGLLTAMPAWGWGNGWDTDSIYSVPGEWVQPNVNFGMDVHPDPNITVQTLTSTYSAPPAEPWCGTSHVPTMNECDGYLNDLDWWTADIMGLNDPGEIPPGTPFAPPLCPNSCLG